MAVPSIGHGEVIPHTYSFMLIGQRVREIRDAKNLGQTDIERATGLVRPYISRVENGLTCALAFE